MDKLESKVIVIKSSNEGRARWAKEMRELHGREKWPGQKIGVPQGCYVEGNRVFKQVYGGHPKIVGRIVGGRYRPNLYK